jgi:hypothetical protein
MQNALQRLLLTRTEPDITENRWHDSVNVPGKGVANKQRGEAAEAKRQLHDQDFFLTRLKATGFNYYRFCHHYKLRKMIGKKGI